jgi:hypothetical protein
MSDKHKHDGELDSDLKEYFSYKENKNYAYQDPMNEQDMNIRKMSKDKEKQIEDYKRDKDFYYKSDSKKNEEEMVHRDAERNFEEEKKVRKSSLEIIKDTEKQHRESADS